MLWVLLAAVAAYLFLFEPGRMGFFPGCPIRAITGYTCPGCGSTRALHQLLHGHLLAALELNPLVVIALPFLIATLVIYTRAAFQGETMPRISLPSKYIWIAAILVMGFWIGRNIPGYPFPV